MDVFCSRGEVYTGTVPFIAEYLKKYLAPRIFLKCVIKSQFNGILFYLRVHGSLFNCILFYLESTRQFI